jgi:hypothetical protein
MGKVTEVKKDWGLADMRIIGKAILEAKEVELFTWEDEKIGKWKLGIKIRGNKELGFIVVSRKDGKGVCVVVDREDLQISKTGMKKEVITI